MVHFEVTPKALANFSPGLERSENPGTKTRKQLNPVRVYCEANPYRVQETVVIHPGLSLRSNPGLKLANAFGVFQTEPVR